MTDTKKEISCMSKSKELLFQLYVTTPIIFIAQAIIIATWDLQVPDRNEWFFYFFIFLLLCIPINVIIYFILLGIRKGLKKYLQH